MQIGFNDPWGNPVACVDSECVPTIGTWVRFPAIGGQPRFRVDDIRWDIDGRFILVTVILNDGGMGKEAFKAVRADLKKRAKEGTS